MYQCPRCLGWYDSYHYCNCGQTTTYTYIPVKKEPKYCDQCGKKIEHKCDE